VATIEVSGSTLYRHLAAGLSPSALRLHRDLAVPRSGTVVGEMSTEPFTPNATEHLELSVPELLLRARPLPPPGEMVIEDLSEEEGAAFLAALEA
jgi:hypothetical protein